MTVRQTKRLVTILGGLLALLTAINLGLLFLRPARQPDLSEFMLPLVVLVMLSSVWRSLSRTEAQHGPDYVQPRSKAARPLLIGLGVIAMILGGVAAYMIATHR
jgi:membrane protein CcdC involved in cytochrome C biogenesis